jgi:hypothetical protein
LNHYFLLISLFILITKYTKDSTINYWMNVNKYTSEVASAMRDSFSELFVDALQGKLKSFSQYFKSILRSIESAFAKFLANKLVSQLFGLGSSSSGGGFFSSIISSLLGGFGGGVSGSTSSASSWVSRGFTLASGGLVPGGFQAFASGGIAKEPTLGLIGEGNFNEAVVPLPDGKSIPVKGGSMNVQVNINNETGQPVKGEKGEVRFDGEQYVVDVVLKNVHSYGSLYHLFKGGVV